MKRGFPYRCRYCGCFLDPGEGSVCTDCRKEQERAEEGRQRLLRNDDYGITAAERLEGACVTVGTCPFCGTEHVFRSIGPPDEELLVMWAMERCGCLEARMERMARAEARREARRKRDDTY